jgi:hypothetical protein
VDTIRGFRPRNVWTKTFVFVLTIDRENTDRCFWYACYGNPSTQNCGFSEFATSVDVGIRPRS